MERRGGKMNLKDSSSAVKLVCFEVRGSTYALPLSMIRSIQRVESFPVAPAEDGSIGSVAFTGGPIPVFGLPFLDAPSGTVAGVRYVIVIRDYVSLWGLLVDQIVERLSVASDALFPLPRTIGKAGGFFSRVAVLEERILLVLAPESLRNASTSEAEGAQGDEPETPLPSGLKKSTSPPRRRGQLIVFRTGTPPEGEPSYSFGLSITQIAEILRPSVPVPVPGARRGVLGLLPWRGQPLVLLDLNEKLRLARPRPIAEGRFLVVKSRRWDGYVAWAVEGDVRLLSLPVATWPAAAPAPIDAGLVLGQFELPGETIVIPALDSLLG
jgi:chemotaxis signal transduction protein